MNRTHFSFFMGLGLVASCLAGCTEEGGGGTGGGGTDDDSSGNTSGAGPTRTHIGTALLFTVNPTDATVSVRDPHQGDDPRWNWTLPPRSGQWLDLRVYGGGCPDDASSCLSLSLEGIPDIVAVDIQILLDAEMLLVLDRSGAFFDTKDLAAPSPGNASIRYVGSTLFGTVTGDEITPLTGLTEVPGQVQVGYGDGEDGHTLLNGGAPPFVAGQRYFVDGKREAPPSLLVCDLSKAEPPIGCVDLVAD
jgi:hypothetical protein